MIIFCRTKIEFAALFNARMKINLNCAGITQLYNDTTGDVCIQLSASRKIRLHSKVLIYHSGYLKDALENMKFDLMYAPVVVIKLPSTQSECVYAEYLFKIMYGFTINCGNYADTMIGLLNTAARLRARQIQTKLEEMVLKEKPEIKTIDHWARYFTYAENHCFRMMEWLIKDFPISQAELLFPQIRSSIIDVLIKKSGLPMARQEELYSRYYRGQDLKDKLAALKA